MGDVPNTVLYEMRRSGCPRVKELNNQPHPFPAFPKEPIGLTLKGDGPTQQVVIVLHRGRFEGYPIQTAFLCSFDQITNVLYYVFRCARGERVRRCLREASLRFLLDTIERVLAVRWIAKYKFVQYGLGVGFSNSFILRHIISFLDL